MFDKLKELVAQLEFIPEHDYKQSVAWRKLLQEIKTEAQNVRNHLNWNKNKVKTE